MDREGACFLIPSSTSFSATVGMSFSQTFTVDDGGMNFDYSFDFSGSLPAGLMTSSTATSFTIFGSPTETGSFSFTIDPAPLTGPCDPLAENYMIVVNPAPSCDPTLSPSSG
ncbi:MAG: putative Ig domain-containing protein, partial [Acidobacteriota bacterium]|nr:putative Ig domain-containing protein [Acidobacteriota bacterium]